MILAPKLPTDGHAVTSSSLVITCLCEVVGTDASLSSALNLVLLCRHRADLGDRKGQSVPTVFSACPQVALSSTEKSLR